MSTNPTPEHSRPAIPGFEVHARIGSGASGEVWRATEQSSSRVVALKVLHLRGSLPAAETEWRFRREIEATALQNHENIARIFASGVADGRPWLAMEFIPGIPLDTFVHERKPGIRELLAIFLKVCDAVRHAHDNGVIHRDLKPANILVRADCTPKILDFGLARFLDDAATGHSFSVDGSVTGTPMFMAPEQAEGKVGETGITADVYALGVILFHITTGGWPYDDTLSPAQLVNVICTRDPRPARAVNAELDRDLDAIITRCIAREKTDRYPSVTELRADIARFLAGEAVHARRGALLYHARKWARRHWKPVAAAAALITTGAVLGALWLRERQAAEAERRRTLTQAQELLNAALLDLHGKLDAIGHPEWITDAAQSIAAMPWGRESDSPLDIRRYQALVAEIRGTTFAAKSDAINALTAYREAHGHLAALPRTPAIRAESARIHVAKGRAQLDMNQTEAAIEAADRAGAELAGIETAAPGILSTAIGIRTVRAEALARKRQPMDAEREWAAAAALAATSSPIEVAAATNFAYVFNNLGSIRLSLAREDDALEAFTRAESRIRPLAAKNPDHWQTAMQLAKTLRGHAAIHLARGKLDSALPAIAEARALHRRHRPFHQVEMIGPDTDMARAGLALALAELAAARDPLPAFALALEDAGFAHAPNHGNLRVRAVMFEICHARGNHLEKTGDLPAAAEDLQSALTHLRSYYRTSRDPEDHFAFAFLHLRLMDLPPTKNGPKREARAPIIEQALTSASRLPLDPAQTRRLADLRALLEKATAPR